MFSWLANSYVYKDFIVTAHARYRPSIAHVLAPRTCDFPQFTGYRIIGRYSVSETVGVHTRQRPGNGTVGDCLASNRSFGRPVMTGCLRLMSACLLIHFILLGLVITSDQSPSHHAHLVHIIHYQSPRTQIVHDVSRYYWEKFLKLAGMCL